MYRVLVNYCDTPIPRSPLKVVCVESLDCAPSSTAAGTDDIDNDCVHDTHCFPVCLLVDDAYLQAPVLYPPVSVDDVDRRAVTAAVEDCPGAVRAERVVVSSSTQTSSSMPRPRPPPSSSVEGGDADSRQQLFQFQQLIGLTETRAQQNIEFIIDGSRGAGPGIR